MILLRGDPVLTLPPLGRWEIFAGGGLAEKALFCFPCTPYATDLPDVFNDGFVPELQSTHARFGFFFNVH